jgi:sialate O-acetylesterase
MKQSSFYSKIFIVFTSMFFFNCQMEKKQLRVAPVFSDHMVLQQQKNVPIWGTGEPGAEIIITASWGDEVKTKVAESGNWQAAISTPKFGGPYDMKISSMDQNILFQDVMLGEVWLTSGQSNMEWPMYARINNQTEEIENANYPNIRMFTVPRNLNGTNINDAKWNVTTPENVREFSAVGYFFARELNQKLQIPIGILNTSWGGTRVEAWTSIEKLASMEPSASEANEILDQGGVSAIRANNFKNNQELVKANEKYLGAPSFSIPENIEEWKSFKLNDLDFATPEFDDSSWKSFEASGSSGEFITYEKFFRKGTYAENGVLWLRKTFDVEDPDLAYNFIVNGGIDDFDYTYINGTLIGNTLACCLDRSYKIPEGLLKKEGNVLAIRIIDTSGDGAFRGAAFLETQDKKHQLDKGSWRLKHHAFFLNTSIQEHHLDFESLLKNEAEIQANLKTGQSLNDPNVYSILFQTMVQPVIPYAIKGALWYQGESNVGNHQEYQTLFSGMINDWRARWNAEFPFYFVQIAPYEYTPEASSQSVRDAQRKTLTLDNTGMAITMDIGEEKDIHPANKQDVGLRLARLALHNDYGQKDLVKTGPLYRNQSLHTTYIDLSFDYIGSGLIAKNDLLGFEIATENGSFFPAKAKIVGDKIRVSSNKVKNPKRVRYGWKNYFEATLFNKEGLPASSFETP